MKRCLLLWCFGLLVLPIFSAIYVAPYGDDNATGTIECPIRSLEVAQARLRLNGGGEVFLFDGVYELDKPLMFSKADSNQVWRAVNGAKPVLSAGRLVKNWQVDNKGWWHASIPAASKSAHFYVNHQRRLRPFLPRKGYYYVAHEAVRGDNGEQQFHADKKDFNANWSNLSDIEVCIFNHWNLSRLPVKCYDAKTGLVTLGAPFKEKTCYYSLAPNNWYRLDNVKDALGEAGDWYVEKNGDLTYVPMPDETPENSECVVAVLDYAVKISEAKNIQFEGITFAYVNWHIPPTGHAHAQAAADLPGAIQVDYADGITLRHCAVIHSGAYAVAFADGARNCSAVDCELVDLGAGGVKIGCEWKGNNGPKSYGANCVVENCLIHGGGRCDPAGVGVFLAHAHNCRVAHNTIYDLHYSGVSLGWNWGFAESAHDNIIEWNHIYHIGKQVLSDMGGIYSLGRQRGSVERFNHIHDITRARYGAFGIYFDSGSSFITVTNNFVHDVEDCSLYLQTLSGSNTVENNVMVNSPKSQLFIPNRDKGALTSRFARNLVGWREGTLFNTSVPPALTLELEKNIFWSEGYAESPKGNIRGFEQGDFGFAYTADGKDFRISNSDMTKKIGFVPFSVAEAGRKGEAVFTDKMPIVPDVFFPAPALPMRICKEDFELCDDTNPFSGWQFIPSHTQPFAHVTKDIVKQGKRALEITDTVGDWTPHFCDWPNRSEGLVTVIFWLRVGEGAQPCFEVRDREGWCATPGPWFIVDAEGYINTRGKNRIIKVPYNTWFKVKVQVKVGKARVDDTFSLSFLLPNEKEERVWTGLPLHPRFKSVGWVGFVSNGKLGSKYWIDDFRLEP